MDLTFNVGSQYSQTLPKHQFQIYRRKQKISVVQPYNRNHLYNIQSQEKFVNLQDGKYLRQVSQQINNQFFKYEIKAKDTAIQAQNKKYNTGDQNFQQEEKIQAKGQSSDKLSIPTILTIFRVAIIPFLGAGYYMLPPIYSAVTTSSVFVFAAITDFLDGYIARKYNLKSKFGAFLDPVADKLMVMAVLIMLSSTPPQLSFVAGNQWIIPALTIGIIGREIVISALREWAANLGPQAHSAVQVNTYGKYKTATQMIALTILLLLKDGSLSIFPESINQFLANTGMICLGIASILTVQSMYVYFKGVWKYL